MLFWRRLREQARPSIGCLRDQARSDEAIEPSCTWTQARPVVEGKIDDDEAGRRQFFVDALACLFVPGRDQCHREVVQAGLCPTTSSTCASRVLRMMLMSLSRPAL
jgi:hypothetical protein